MYLFVTSVTGNKVRHQGLHMHHTDLSVVALRAKALAMIAQLTTDAFQDCMRTCRDEMNPENLREVVSHSID